jgi:Gas vesicle protein
MPRDDHALVEQILPPDSTLLDVIDHLLNKGVMANGDVTLGVAGIDLIYLRLSALLCAADRILPPDPATPPRKRRGGSRVRRKTRS